MKIRNGFVSNSSSSSFIIGIAKIEDREKFDAWLEENADKLGYDFGSAFSPLKICKVKDLDSEYKKEAIVSVESFIWADVNIPLDELDDEDEVVIFDFIGDEGDSCFSVYDGDDWVDYDYDIDLDFFEEPEQKAYDGLSEENGLSMVSKTYGAGRNG